MNRHRPVQTESEPSVEVHIDEQEAAAADVVVQASQWEPDVKIYQHVREELLRTYHGMWNHQQTISCGYQLTNDYRLVAEVPFLHFRQCNVNVVFRRSPSRMSELSHLRCKSNVRKTALISEYALIGVAYARMCWCHRLHSMCDFPAVFVNQAGFVGI